MAGIALWDPPFDTSLIVSYDVFFAQVGVVEGGVVVVWKLENPQGNQEGFNLLFFGLFNCI